jgi:hypothetical protein
MRSPALSPDNGSGVSCQKVLYINLLKCEYLNLSALSRL